VENRSRRRALVAGLAGTALTALGGRRVSATPPTEPPGRPTDADTALLARAQEVELTARDLYEAAIAEGAAGDEDRVLMAARANHQAAADGLSALIGNDAPQMADAELFDQYADRFRTSDITTAATAGYELESTLVATHTELVGQLEGVDGARTIAAVLIMEARTATVLADLAGEGDDLTALFDNDARALTVSASEG
jgi:hypothetical protein